jgi:hypothetical protein
MDREPDHLLDTREFTAKWHNIVEEHVVPTLATVLPRLMPDASSENVSPQQWETLARQVAHALQLAGNPAGGVQAAVDYLQHMANDPRDEPR